MDEPVVVPAPSESAVDRRKLWQQKADKSELKPLQDAVEALAVLVTAMEHRMAAMEKGRKP